MLNAINPNCIVLTYSYNFQDLALLCTVLFCITHERRQHETIDVETLYIFLSEISLTQKDKNLTFSPMCGNLKKKKS